MKTGRTLPGLAAELYRQAEAKRDLLLPAGELKISSNGHSELHHRDAYTVGDIAHSQIADYLGIPKGFYDFLRARTETLRIRSEQMHGIVPSLPAQYRNNAEGTDERAQDADYPLFDVLVNRLMQEKGEETRLVRTLDGKARAFLSSSFNPDMDNFDVLAMAAKAMEEAGLCPEDVQSCEVTERRLYIKVVTPKIEAVIRPDNLYREHSGHHFLKEPQVVRAGFVLMNSETGLGALTVQQTVYKLMCTNLWIKEEAYRQRHIGKALQAEEDGSVYRSDTRKADAQAKLLKIRDHITAALDEAKFRHLVVKMQESADIRLEGGVEKTVEVTAKKFGLSQTEKEDVLKHLIAGADLSLWGISNAITATAQTAESYDRATELEAIGGRFFTLPTAEIKEIARAA